MDWGEDEEIHTENSKLFVHTEQPFDTFRPYLKRRILSVDSTFDEHTVSDDTISKRMTSDESFTLNDETEYRSAIELEFYHHQEQCNVYSSLKFGVDLSFPMSIRELEQTVARFKNEICNAQNNNRRAGMLMASTFKELHDAYLQPKLKHVPISEFMEIFSGGLTGKLSLNKIKLFLCGMIVYKTRWLQVEQGKNILELTLDLSERLTQDYGRGFSVQNVDRGYQKVKRLLKEQLTDSNFLMD